MVKSLPANAGDVGSIPVSGRSPGAGNSKPLRYSCLGNPMDRRAWRSKATGCKRVRHSAVTNNNKGETWLNLSLEVIQGRLNECMGLT